MFRLMQRFGLDSPARSRGIGPLARVRRRNHPLNCEALESRQLLSAYYIINEYSGKALDTGGAPPGAFRPRHPPAGCLCCERVGNVLGRAARARSVCLENDSGATAVPRCRQS